MKLLKFYLTMLFGLLFLTSCHEDRTTSQEVETEEVSPTNDYENGLLDKTTVSNEDLELEDALASSGGITGNGIEGLRCYPFNFPISVELFDGSTQTIKNGVEFGDILNSGDMTGFAFPLPLFTADTATGELIPFTVNNKNELDVALEKCRNSTNDASGDLACYNYVYPFEIENTETGEKFTVNSKQEFLDLTSPGNWFPYNYVMPLSLEHKDTGKVITVTTRKQLSKAMYDCY